MKSLIVLILVIGALFNIAGCVKAKNDWTQFQAEHSSLSGMAVDFVRGYAGASQGDYAGPALGIMDQGQALENAKNDHQFWAWVWSAITLLILMAVNKNSKAPSQ